jgi:hypothetical protein
LSGWKAARKGAFACLNGLGGYVQIFDRKYRLFGVINLIDLLVIVGVLVAGFAVYRVLSNNKQTAAKEEGTDFTYTVLCPNTRGISASQVKVGDAIYKNTGKPIGTVTAVRVVPSPGDAYDTQAQSITRFSSSIMKDIYIDVAAKGMPNATGVVVGDLLLHGGQPMPVMTSTFQCDTASIATLTIAGQ